MASLLNRILGIAASAARDVATGVVKSELAKRSGSPERATASPGAGAERRPSSQGGKPRRPRRDSPESSRPARPAPRPSGGSGHGVEVYDVGSRGLPDFSYSPDPDGSADPGEVVWTWVPYEEDASRGKDRPVLVLARQGGLVVAQMTSQDHDRDAAQEARHGRYWHDVGSGPWDPRGRPSEVRLDRLLVVDEEAVRREGATMDRSAFDSVVAALRDHWSHRA